MADGDLLMLDWRKSSASDPDDCVEVALMGNEVRVRESYRPEGNGITFGCVAWASFLRDVCGAVRKP